MANGYASNIPRENVPEETVLVLAEDLCMICKKRHVEREGMCGECANVLQAG